MKTILDLPRKISLSAMAFITTLCIASYSHANFYFGADALVNKMKFKKDYGENIFSKKLTPGLNFFVGGMFHQNFGVEVGYEVEKKMKRTVDVDAGQYVAGVYYPLGGTTFNSYETYVKQKHPYLGFLAKFNIGADNSNFVSIMGGLSISKVEARYRFYKDSSGPQDDVIRTFNTHKVVPTVKIMLEHLFNKHCGARVFLGWKNTARWKTKPREQAAVPEVEARLRNSFKLGFGVNYYI